MFNRKRARGGDYWIDYAACQDQEYHGCTINYDSSEPEPDVGWSGSLEILSVVYSGIDLFPLMTDDEQENVLSRTQEYLTGMAEDHH